MATWMDRINLRTMSDAGVVAHYARGSYLSAAEQASIDRIAPLVRGKPILDIGVGGGRTVPALLEISTDYLGIDYSTGMVEACRRRFPGVRFEHADARLLDTIADGSIFLAVFSCNGLGMVSHEDRLQILRQVHRVLQPGGVFVFSTHNRDSPEFSRGFQLPEFERTRDPLRLAVRSLRWLRQVAVRVRNRARFRRHEVHAKDYAIINDVCHHYGTLLYYLDLGQQRQQLEDTGFAAGAEAYDLEGRRIEGGSRHDSIALVARKPPAMTQTMAEPAMAETGLA